MPTKASTKPPTWITFSSNDLGGDCKENISVEEVSEQDLGWTSGLEKGFRPLHSSTGQMRGFGMPGRKGQGFSTGQSLGFVLGLHTGPSTNNGAGEATVTARMADPKLIVACGHRQK